MKWTLLIIAMLGIGLSFLLRDVDRLRSDGAALPASSALPRPLARPPHEDHQFYYQYTSETGQVRFAPRLEDVPADKRAGAGRVELPGMPAPSVQGPKSAWSSEALRR